MVSEQGPRGYSPTSMNIRNSTPAKFEGIDSRQSGAPLGFVEPDSEESSDIIERNLPLVDRTQICFGEYVLAGFAFDVFACRILAHGQSLDRKRKQPEMVMMQSVLMGRTGAPVADFLEIVDGLLEGLWMAGRPFHK